MSTARHLILQSTVRVDNRFGVEPKTTWSEIVFKIDTRWTLNRKFIKTQVVVYLSRSAIQNLQPRWHEMCSLHVVVLMNKMIIEQIISAVLLNIRDRSSVVG